MRNLGCEPEIEISCYHLLVNKALILFSTSFLNDLIQCIFPVFSNVFSSNRKAGFHLTMILRVTPSFVFLIDQTVSACYMPVAQHFQEVKIKYDISIFKTEIFCKTIIIGN